MDLQISPFKKEDLIPQEETLEITKTKDDLFIGIPKENSFQEKRVCLTPDAVSALVANGHRVLVESGAGLGASFSDHLYSEAGASLTKDTAKVYACPIILKVAPPTLDEIKLLNPQTLLISALQLKTQNKTYFEALAAKRVTALAFEFIKDDDGAYPAVKALSEIAGTASVLIAAELLSTSSNGNGLLMGNISGVPPTEVLILGAGTVGEFASRAALGLGASIKAFDNSITKLRRLKSKLKQGVYTSSIQPKTLLKALKRCDVLIGSVRGKNRSPIIVTEDMVKHMKPGAVIIDVSIDMGGCVETSKPTTHANPTFMVDEVVHYCVANMPGGVPRTSTLALNNATLPFLVKLANKGYQKALGEDKNFLAGLNVHKGHVTYKAVADVFGHEYVNPGDAIKN